MEGCPYVEDRPSVQYRRTLGIDSMSDQPNGRRHNTTSRFIAVGIGLSIGGSPMHALKSMMLNAINQKNEHVAKKPKSAQLPHGHAEWRAKSRHSEA